ncbi:anthranilate synthase component I [Pleurocapsales cyanobacterium LEGE 10410]|nr:anthranilate synthase component I [Pleurocapsales cyanobacterium LEGE 10410]
MGKAKLESDHQTAITWHWRSLPVKNRTGSEIFAALFADEQIATLLESPGIVSKLGQSPSEYASRSRYSICGGKPRTVGGKLQLWTPAVGEVLPFLRSLLQRESTAHYNSSNLPFTGGWLGWLGYDLAWEIEQLPNLNRDPLPFPVAYWYEPECFAVVDHLEQTLWLAAGDDRQLDLLETKLSEPTSHQNFGQTPPNTAPISFLTDQEQYQNAVKQAKQYIQTGDIFQANLSLRFKTTTTDDSWSIYRQLQQINPSPFASYWRSPWGDVISCSPERLVRLEDNLAQTRPIAGTRPRGNNKQRDRALAEELLANTKEQAEHIMLVDLERNDLGRVCQWGSVEVDELLAIERYSHVMHLVSNVRGILQSDRDAVDLIKGVFPGGTITGCPKVRCMEIIEELEPVRRNLFYGSCGYLDRRGNLDLNILIRTLLYVRPANSTMAQVYGQVGAGIVADSDPTREWYESLNKAEAQIAALYSRTKLH